MLETFWAWISFMCFSSEYAGDYKAEDEMLCPEGISAQLSSGFLSPCVFLQLTESVKGSGQHSQPFPRWGEKQGLNHDPSVSIKLMQNFQR